MKKEVKLLVILSAIFISNVILAEFIGVKIFSLEQTFGYEPLSTLWWGIPISLTYTAGVVIWPVVFVLTDIINDYYGRRGVKFLSLLAVGVSLYAFMVINVAIHLSPADFWKNIHIDKGLPDFNQAFQLIFGQGNNIIIGSLVAFVIGQMIDVMVFQKIKETSEHNPLWVRATVSTLISQLIDSFVVLYIAFYIGQNWSLTQVLVIALNNYIYKGVVAVLMIPVLQFIHHRIERYLGLEMANKMRHQAMKNETIF